MQIYLHWKNKTPHSPQVFGTCRSFPSHGKKLKGQKSTTVRDHMLLCDTIVRSEDFKVIGRDNIDHHLRIKESLFIKKEMPGLNIQGKSVPLPCSSLTFPTPTVSCFNHDYYGCYFSESIFLKMVAVTIESLKIQKIHVVFTLWASLLAHMPHIDEGGISLTN